VSDENEIDNRRRLAERVSGIETDLYGFRGQPGRLADMEASVKLERAERIAAVKAVDDRSPMSTYDSALASCSITS
jgi:hypothetical protein